MQAYMCSTCGWEMWRLVEGLTVHCQGPLQRSAQQYSAGCPAEPYSSTSSRACQQTDSSMLPGRWRPPVRQQHRVNMTCAS